MRSKLLWLLLLAFLAGGVYMLIATVINAQQESAWEEEFTRNLDRVQSDLDFINDTLLEAAQAPTCDDSLWQHIYHPARTSKQSRTL